MSLEQLLSEHKGAILAAWWDRVLATYPPEAARFLSTEEDPFANPVGTALRRGLTGVVDSLVRNTGPEEVTPHLDQILRIRAVQGGPPSESAGLIVLLKKAVRDALAVAGREGRISPEDLLALDERIDALVLMAFDVYMRCREQIYEVRTAEVRHRLFRLLQKAQLMAPDPATGPELDGVACDGP